MFGALASLLFLGRLTDRFGFVAVLRAGLILMTLGVLASTVAWNVPSFALGRVVIGVASGLITTSASVGMTRLNNRGDLQRAAATTSLTIAFGFGLGPVVGGLIAQWLPWPLVTAYVPSLGLGLLAIYALYQVRIPGPADLKPAQPPALHWRDFMPTITLPERRFARHYALGGMCAFCAFGMFSLFASLAPSFMQRMVPWHGPAVSGLSIGVILFLSAGFQYLARPRPTKGSALLFALSVIATAAGHGLCNLAGMSIVNKVSTPATRTGLLSTYLVIGYLGTIVPILGLGWLSDHIGITEAMVAYCIVMGALAAWLGWMCTRTPTLPMPKH
jgi:MFS family permease